MPWAATNSPDLKAFLDADGAAAILLKKAMFGTRDAAANKADPQILTILDNDLGSQRVSYTEDKGLDVGGWGVKLHAENASGFTWTGGGTMTGWGILGLGWQPDRTTPGAAWSVLSRNLDPQTTAPLYVDLYWPEEKDNGLYSLLDTSWNGSSYDDECDLWVGSTCLRPYLSASLSNGEYTVRCHPTMWNTPNEFIAKTVSDQNIFVTNYPQSITGMTANLFGVQMDSSGALTSGVVPFTLRTGKVKPGSRDNGAGVWSINVGGFTDQFKVRPNRQRLEAHIKGYHFNTQDATGYYTAAFTSGDFRHAPHLTIVETYVGGGLPTTSDVTELEIDLTTNDYAEYDTIEEIQQAAITRIQVVDSTGTGALNCAYNLRDDGQLVYESPVSTGDYEVHVYGIVPFVVGWGYVYTKTAQKYFTDLLGGNDPDCFWPLPRGQGSSPAGYMSVTPSGVLPDDKYYMRLDEVGADKLNEGAESKEYFKNRCTCAYFYQYDLSLVDSYSTAAAPWSAWMLGIPKPIPKFDNASPLQRIAYTNQGDVAIAAGDLLQFGPTFGEYARTATVDSVTSTHFTTVDDEMLGAPWAFYWPKGLQDAISNDSGWLEEMAEKLTDYAQVIDQRTSDYAWENAPDNLDTLLAGYDIGDPFVIRDVSAVESGTASWIFRSLLGDDAFDVGLPKSSLITYINDVTDRGQQNNLGLINFDGIDTVINNSPIIGAKFQLKPGDNSNREQTYSVLEMLNHLMLTHGGRMVWKWSETKRSWFLDFEQEGSDSIAIASNNSRRVAAGEVQNVNQTGTIGGDWYYSKLSATYKQDNGNDVKINAKLQDSRIRNMTADKTINIKDDMTVVPSNNLGDVTSDMVEWFSSLLFGWSFVQYQHTLQLTLRPSARLAVGSGAIFNSAPIPDRSTGRRNTGDVYGEVRGMTTNLGARPHLSVDIVVDPLKRLGWAPTIVIDTFTRSGTTIEATGISTNAAANIWGVPSGLTDLAYFGCFEVGADGVVAAKSGCTCGDYAITLLEKDTDALYYDVAGAYANQNVWRGTVNVTAADIAAGTCTIELENANNFDNLKDYVMIFSHRGDANLQTCQTDLYGWLGDSSNQVTDSASAKSTPILVRP
jgi:hypothetical protein